MSVTLRDSFANTLYSDFKADLAGHWTDKIGDEMLKAVCERAMELAQRYYRPMSSGSRLEYEHQVANNKIAEQRTRIFELENKLAQADKRLKDRDKQIAEMKEQTDDDE